MIIKTIKKLKEVISNLPDDTKIKVASDEEWNSIFTKVEINMDDKKAVVFWGQSGSHEEQEC